MAYKLLDDAIKARFKRNLTKQNSFQERIEKTLSKYHGKFEDFETLFPKFEEVAKDLSAETQREKGLQLSDEEIAFYDIILMGRQNLESDKVVRQIAIDVTDYVKKNTKIDWLNQESIKAKIRAGVKRILLEFNFPAESFEKLVPVIMQQAESNYSGVEYETTNI